MSSTTTLQVEYVNPKELKHSEYSRQLFPALKGDAYVMLKRDIQENGVRTPIEVNGDNIVLCGNERLRVALELGLSQVPIVYWKNGNGVNQKIRIIRDNLARKAVDFRTKLRCYKELRKLYGLKNGQTKSKLARSEDRPILSEDEIAQEIGFSRRTLERAEKIEGSNFPEEIKQATFTGQLAIRPTADLVDEPKDIQDKVLAITKEQLDDGKHVTLEKITRDVKQQKEIEKALTEAGIPTVQDQVQNFYGKVKVPHQTGKTLLKREDLAQHVLNFVQQNLSCPQCGEKQIIWKCGHEFH